MIVFFLFLFFSPDFSEAQLLGNLPFIQTEFQRAFTAYGPGLGVFGPYSYVDLFYDNIPFIGKIPVIGKDGTSSRTGISPFYPVGGNPSNPFPPLYKARPLPIHVPDPVEVVAVPLDEEALHGEKLFPDELVLPWLRETAADPNEKKKKITEDGEQAPNPFGEDAGVEEFSESKEQGPEVKEKVIEKIKEEDSEEYEDEECHCSDWYTGDICEVRKECISNPNNDACDCPDDPCSNNATCIEHKYSPPYECKCISQNFTGSKCENEPCNPSPCQHGGHCYTKSDGGRECRCLSIWTGWYCEQFNICGGGTACMNGGTCVPSPDGNNKTCNCVPGWEGDVCQNMTDNCDPNPCQGNSTCTNLFNDYSCECIVGLQGKSCEQTSADECLKIKGACILGSICPSDWKCFSGVCCVTDPAENCDNAMGDAFCDAHVDACNDPTTGPQMKIQCASTCKSCTSSPASPPVSPPATPCEDKVNPATGVSDCPQDKYLCNDPNYKELMKEQCPKTCGYCSS
ncbi:hypothetical protein FO519_002249 [Halicephalobus sp. NKZ332]|nr:hypothetical protein FO519_002249 [Halicephalobus sp. NKZ332]